MPTLNRRIERLEAIYPRLTEEIEKLINELVELEGEEYVKKFIEDFAKERGIT